MKQGRLFADDAEARRGALVARWLTLTRRTLPALAVTQGWPIRHDHCVMRVCLDAALGVPWSATVKAPAVRHMTVAQLSAAVRVAEGIAAAPATLPALNRASIAGRRTRAGQS